MWRADCLDVENEERSKMIWFAVYTAVIGEIEEDDGVGKPIPKKLTNLLDKFEDRMPDVFPKILPPRRIVDH